MEDNAKAGIPHPIISDRLVDKRVCAEILGVKPVTVHKWLRERKIGSYKLGRSVRVSIAEIHKFMERNRIPARPERDVRR